MVLPGSREELIEVVRLLHAPGLRSWRAAPAPGSPAARSPSGDAVLVALTRLNRILQRRPGAAAAPWSSPASSTRGSPRPSLPHGLHYAPDPSSQTACTIGGNVAENAGGPHCLKYGVTTNHVVELEVVLPDGSLVRLGSPHGEAWGPDLVGLFVGSEGMFGIACSITVRLEPIPAAVRTLLADFPSIRAASEAVSAIIAVGHRAGRAGDDGPGLRRGGGGVDLRRGLSRPTPPPCCWSSWTASPRRVAAEHAVVEPLLRAHRRPRRPHRRDAAERARLWQGRKKAFGAMGRIAPDLVVQDAVVPRSALPDVLDRISEIRDRYGLHISNVFHAGDGNLHPNISFDRRNVAARRRACATRAARSWPPASPPAAASPASTAWASTSSTTCRSSSTPRRSAPCSAVRRVFDPGERANPGKVVPDPRLPGMVRHPRRADGTQDAVAGGGGP